MTDAISNRPDRKDLVPALIGDHRDFLIVAGLAGTGKDIGALTDQGENTFILGGAMGAGVMVGLGLALAQPNRRVLSVFGDGDLLMNLGSLCNVAVQQPGNFVMICVDNALYGETGDQKSHTAHGADLAAIARGAGIKTVRTAATVEDAKGLSASLRTDAGPVFVHALVNGAPPPRYNRSWDAVERKLIFRKALLGE